MQTTELLHLTQQGDTCVSTGVAQERDSTRSHRTFVCSDISFSSRLSAGYTSKCA